MEQEIVFTNQPETEIAVKELIGQLKNVPGKYDAVLFFASSEYDFSLLSSLLHDKFCNAEVIGTTTSGEISNSGFTKNSIVLTALSCTEHGFQALHLTELTNFRLCTSKNLKMLQEKSELSAQIQCRTKMRLQLHL